MLIAGGVGIVLAVGLVFGGVQSMQPSGGSPKPLGDSIVSYSER